LTAYAAPASAIARAEIPTKHKNLCAAWHSSTWRLGRSDTFSKKLENLEAALRLHFAVYNYVKRHSSLDGSTPAMAAGVSSELWEVADLVALAGW
jgi:hypothetical protein